MSEGSPMRAVVLGHADLPAGMVDAVRHITGCEPDVIVPVSNRGMSPEALADAVSDALEDGAGLVFTDLPSGSCGFVARRLAQLNPGLVVVSGANLAVLIEFVMNRSLPLEQLVPRLLSRGRAAIGCSQPDLEDHDSRAVPGR
jgi:mannose/fructose-specific phosphotransferase system component IIA